MQAPTGVFTKWSDGLLSYKMIPLGRYATEDDLAEDFKIINFIQKGAKSPFLGDLRDLDHFSGMQRKYVSDRMPLFSNRAAALVSSPLSRILVNTYQILNKPLIPSQAFTNEEKALKWLKQQ